MLTVKGRSLLPRIPGTQAMGTRFTPEQFGNAERAGAPRKESSFGNKRAWRDYQERWFKALKPDETLADEGSERTRAWKAATRQYGQIEAARLKLSSESIEVTANVTVRNRLHVSNEWLRAKAPELTDVQLATPVATRRRSSTWCAGYARACRRRWARRAARTPSCTRCQKQQRQMVRRSGGRIGIASAKRSSCTG